MPPYLLNVLSMFLHINHPMDGTLSREPKEAVWTNSVEVSLAVSLWSHAVVLLLLWFHFIVVLSDTLGSRPRGQLTTTAFNMDKWIKITLIYVCI